MALWYITAPPGVEHACRKDTAIDQSVALCEGSYDTLRITGDDLTISCEGPICCAADDATLFSLQGNRNVTITDCWTAIDALYVQDFTLTDSTIKNTTNPANIFQATGTVIRDNVIDTTRPIRQVNSTETNTTKIPTIIENKTQPKETLVFEVGDEAMEDILNQILIATYPDLSDKTRNELAQKVTQDYRRSIDAKIHIIRQFDYEENRTFVTINITADEPLRNISIYEVVPKCAAHYAAQITIETQGYEIVQDDPIIVWKLPNLENKLIKYSLPSEIPQPAPGSSSCSH